MTDWYMRVYDLPSHETFQVVIKEDQIEDARKNHAIISPDPFPGLPVRSRFRSEREQAA